MRTLAALAVFVAVLAWHGEVYASCSAQSYIINGRLMVCTVCCAYGNCTTSCTGG